MARPICIGILMDYLIPPLIDGAGAYARQHGLRIDARWSVRADWMPPDPGWDGVLAHLVDTESAYQRVVELGLPIVHLGGWLGSRARPRVECDYEECGRMAVEEFRQLGLCRVAAMHGRRSNVDWNSFRGVRLAAAKAGIGFLWLDPLRSGEMWPERMARLVDEIGGLEFPLGLFLPHAGITVSLLDGLAFRGIRVPEDVSIIVIDKDPQRTAELAPVPLTAVEPDFWQQGYEAAARLDRILRHGETDRSIFRVPPIGIVRRNSTGASATRDPVVAKALHLIDERAGQLSSVDELARMVGVSRRTLETRFRRETGVTLHAAQLGRRISLAKLHLRNEGRTVTEVAELAGFSSVHYFTTAFRRMVGIAPGEYRKRHATRKAAG